MRFSPVLLAERAREATRKAASLEKIRGRPGAWRPVNELLGQPLTETWIEAPQRVPAEAGHALELAAGTAGQHKVGIDPMCLLCQGDIGSDIRRHHRCPAWDAWRRERRPDDLRRVADVVHRMGQPFDELFSLGLYVDLSQLLHRATWQWQWEGRSRGSVALAPCRL